MKKNIIVILFLSSLLALIIFTNKNALNIENVIASPIIYSEDDKVIESAKSELNKFLNFVPQGYESLYGFKDRDDFSKVEIGIPFRLYSISIEFLNNPQNLLKDFIYPMDIWRVPLVIDDRMVSLLTVEKGKDNIYKCVNIGGAALANELNDYEKYFDAKEQKHIILRIYNIQSDLLCIVEKDKDISTGDFYLLTSAKMSLHKSYEINVQPYKLDMISDAIRICLQENNSNTKEGR